MKKYIFPLILLTAGLAGCLKEDAITKKHFESPKSPLTEIYSKYPGLEQELGKQLRVLDAKIMNRLGVETDSLYDKDSDAEYTTALTDMIGKELKIIENRADSAFHLNLGDKSHLKKCLEGDYFQKFGE
jgi:hypothetical protein